MVADEPEPEPEPLVPVTDVRPVGVDPWLETRLDHPEDVAVAANGILFAGGEAGQLYRVDPASNTVTEIGRTDGMILGVELGPEGDLYACDFQDHAVYRLPLENGRPVGDLEPYLQGGPDVPPLHPNYVTFDDEGRLYVSDSGRREKLPGPFEDSDGCIFVEHPDGTREVLTDELSAFPNGIALSADCETLYVCETGTHRIHAVQLDAGTVADIESVTEECGMVDGVALDAQERLYVASIGDNAVYRVSDTGIETIVRDGDGLTINNPTNVAFGGPQMHTLYVANLGAPHISAVEIDAVGRHPPVR
jgi:sugar lactone lactonase YvrE